MLELIVYRSKENDEITHISKANDKCTPEAIKAYNNNHNWKDYVEKISVEKNSVIAYLFNQKAVKREEFFEQMRDIQDMVERISGDMDDKLSELEELYKEKGED